MALRTPENEDDRLNPGQADYDSKFNNIAKREEAGTFNDASKNYNQAAHPSQENANIAKAQHREKDPSAPWKADVASIAERTARIRSGTANKASKKSPLAAILVILFGSGATFAGLFSALSLLPIHIFEQFTNKYDAQNTSFTIRTDKIINAKITKDTTSGSCTFVKFACRFTSPSNKLLRNLAKNGIQAVGSDGTPSKQNALFPNERPKNYRFTDTSGKVIDVSPKEFSAALKNNAAFRAAFHAAYTPRFVGFADSIFQKIKSRFSIKMSDTMKDSKDSKDVTKKLNDASKGPETGASGAKSAEKVIADQATEMIDKEIKQVAKSGKGNAFGLIAGVTCGLMDIPGLTARIVRVYQMAQLIKYASAILTVIGAWKAGDAKPEEVSAIGDMFTQTVNSKSAMDAFGMKYSLFGDTQPSSDSYKAFSPGGNVALALGSATQFTDSVEKKEACKWATNPVTGAAIDVATAGTVIAPLINLGAGVAISVTLEKLAPYLAKLAVDFLRGTGVLGSIMNFFLGDLTKNLLPDGVGNAFPSGASHLMGQTANAGGNTPLTLSDKLAYDQTTKQVQLAYAQEDRATLSPLDATNSNTMLGSLVSQLIPYYSKLSSLSGVISTIGSIVTGSIGRLSSVSAASTDNAAQYKMCDDPLIKNQDIAAGPFCNIEYGIPPKWLDKDPEAVLSALSSEINQDTGEPISTDNALTSFDPTHTATGSLSGWIDLCTDGSTAHANDCKITDERTANYALYVIDHRIQTTMDGEDKVLEGVLPVDASGAAAAPGNTSDPASLTVVVNKKHPLNPTNYTPSNLTNVGNDNVLRADAAGAFASMQTAAASAGNPLTPISGYRSYDTQVRVYNGWVSSLGQAAADATSARPGFSEHQTGLSIDINSLDALFADTPAGKWLAANAYQYGFILRYPNGLTPITGYEYEPWHYRFIGIPAATDMHNKGVTTLEDYYKVSGGDYAYLASPNTVAILTKRYNFV